MARALARLSARRIYTAKPKGRVTQGPNKGKPRDAVLLCDGGGLYAQVTLGKEGNVRRSWIFRYQLSKDHPVHDMGLGPIDDLDLATARELARKYRSLIREGKDPIRERDAERARNLANSTAVMIFDKAAETYIAQHRHSWKNPTHAAQWPATFKQYVSPIIGKMSVNDVDTAHILKVLTPIWTTKPDTAKRIRGRLENIIGWATVVGYRKDANGHDKPNPARWRGHLQTSLAAPSKVRKVQHHAALPYAQIAGFMAELRQRQGMAAFALEFAILTCVRVSDVLNARPAQINRAERRWDIPYLSKTAAPHRVPLSDAALAVIDKAGEIARDIGGAVAASEFLFPNDVTGAALHRNALHAVLRRMGRKGMATAHGFRATFRTWAQERTNFPWELCELVLGHKVGDQVERAYARGDALKKRIAIMQQWANFLARPTKPDKVVVDFARAGA
jgi:integrase